MIWLYFVASYFIGNIMFGYLVTKVFFQEDIRKHGSRNVGARNAGRLHGKKAFVLTFFGDALKGALVIFLARVLQFSEPIQLIGLALAIVGHIKPVILRFSGGKGISTFIGGMLMFQPLIAPVVILAFIVFHLFVNSFTLAGLGAFLFIPVFLQYKNHDWASTLIASGTLLIIFWAHAENIKERLKK